MRKPYTKSVRPILIFIRIRPFRPVVTILFLLPITLFLFEYQSSAHTADSQNDECVILLHGLAKSFRSLEKLEKHLSNQGFRVINLEYPSTKSPIPNLADIFLDEAVTECGQTPYAKIHFVTHSMGGIVVRYYLKHHTLPRLGRVVMLSPPNRGTELVDFFKEGLLFKKTQGPAGLQLGTGDGSLPLELGPVDFELGVIAGDRSFYPLNSALIPGPDDGIVSVQRTKVEGMTDFLLLPYSHPFIMQKETVLEQVVHFLRQGKFDHQEESP